MEFTGMCFHPFLLLIMTEHHYNPLVYHRLQALVSALDWDGLCLYLDTLSNANFRTAGYMLGERFLIDVPSSVFWPMFSRLNAYNSRAFLVTTLKSLVQRIRVGDLSIQDEGFLQFCNQISTNQIDVQKTLQTLLPELSDSQSIRCLFHHLDLNDQARWIPYLIRCNSLPASYLLFSSLRFVEHDHDYLVRVTYFLQKRGGGLSFNLASLIKSYFGLDEVKGTFSLSLKPYELARLENNYDAFCQLMKF